MNVITSSACNRPVFGAFATPNKEIMEHFSDAVLALKPDNRKMFVDEMSKIVKNGSECPVTISHSLVKGYTPVYTPVVRGRAITTNKSHTCVANHILDVMQKAVDYAKNLADADANINKICDIFGVKK